MTDQKREPSEEDLETFDLNNDGKISITEVARERLGAIDARLEQVAKEPGIKGKLAGATHKLLDKIDNDG